MAPLDWRPSAANQADTVASRWAMIEDAVDAPPRSHERAAAIAKASAKYRVSERTIQQYIAQYEAHGMHRLARAKPGNAGKARAIVSLRFDKAFRTSTLVALIAASAPSSICSTS